MPNPEDYDVIEVPTDGDTPIISDDNPDTPIETPDPVTEPETPDPVTEPETPETTETSTTITFELMREQANKAFTLLGNERPLDTWENVRDVLFEYARVKYKMTKPIVLEALVDRMIKDEAGIQQDTMSNVNATYARANDLAVDSSYDGRAIAKP